MDDGHVNRDLEAPQRVRRQSHSLAAVGRSTCADQRQRVHV